MDVPDTPVPKYLKLEQISLDSEILQSFLEANSITHVDIETYFDDDPDQLDFHLQIGAYYCSKIKERSECLLPIVDYPVTIFTKECFKTEMKLKVFIKLFS